MAPSLFMGAKNQHNIFKMGLLKNFRKCKTWTEFLYFGAQIS